MKNILLFLAIISGEMGWSQNGFIPVSPSLDYSSELKYAFPFNCKSDDPLNRVAAIEDFNKKSESLRWRTDKTIQLDSIVRHMPDFTYEGLKRTSITAFEYTDADQVSATISFWVSPVTGDTTGGLREDFQYNSQQKLTQYDYSFWNTSNASWVIYGRQVLDYNGQDLLSGYTIYYNNQNALVPSSKTEITYNGVQLPTLELDYDWDETLSIWKEAYQYEFTYAANKKLSSEILSYKIDSTSQWAWLSKTEYGYSQDVLLTKTIYDWNVNTWDRVSRSFYTYDDQHNLILQADKVWIDPPQMWLDDMEYKYEYDNARRISAKDRRWFNDGHEWILGDSTAIIYNADSDTALVVDYPWVIPTHPIDPKGFTSYTYDPEINFSLIRWPISFWEPLGSTFNKQVKEVYDSNRLSSNPDSSVYYYSTIITAATEITGETLSIYPNPANEEIHILNSLSQSADAIEIYSIEGKLVMTISSLKETEVPIQDLAPGMYAFRIKKGNTFLSGQFIKQ